MSRVQCSGITKKLARCARFVRLPPGQSSGFCSSHTEQVQKQPAVVATPVNEPKRVDYKTSPREPRPFAHPKLSEAVWRELLSHDSVRALYGDKNKWFLFNPNSFDFWGSVSGLDAKAHELVRDMYQKLNIID